MKSTIMINVLALTSILLSASAASADSVYIDPFDIAVGAMKDVSICLSNSQPVSALQFEVNLPEGLELIPQADEWMTLTKRASFDHTLVVNNIGNGDLRVVCYSNSNTVFSGSDGALINMRIKASDDFYGGNISIYNVRLSDISNQDIFIDGIGCYVNYVIPVESVSLSQESLQLKVGESASLETYVLPANATDKTVTWSSDDYGVATVDGDGNVTAVSVGTAAITATCGSVTATCWINVVETPAEGIDLSQTDAQLRVGETFALIATVYPESATDKTVTWSSDDYGVATVDGDGNVTAIAPGIATITAACGNYSASCRLTVVPVMVESIQLSTDNWSGEEGESFTIEATVLPENASDKTIYWTSSDESIATVDEEGNVSVLKEGTCVITATAADGSGISAECFITSNSGVEAIFSSSYRIDIYDMNGIQIRKDADSASLRTLTPGIYIIHRGSEIKKIVIR